MEVTDVSELNVEEVKPCKKRKITEEADRISDLPVAIIHHIFSFLFIVDIVRTSVLARRWRYLWTEAPSLIVDDLLVDTENKFANILNSVQKMYKSMNIEICSLAVQQPFNTKSVDAWVHFVVQRNVKKLRVNAFPGNPLEVPCYRDLNVLKLDLNNGMLVVPITGCFSSLETFSLSRAQFVGDVMLYVISTRYPRLRRLNFNDCLGLDYLNIKCPTLEVLKIRRCFGLNQVNVSASRLQKLSVQNSFTFGCKANSVTISSPSLQIFEWLDYAIDNCHIGSFTSLKVAHISLVFDYYPEVKTNYLRVAKKFLSCLLCAESLKIDMPCFWGLSTHKEVLVGLSTQPYNLKHLTLLVGHDEHVFRGVSNLFENCTNLEVLHIHVNDNNSERLINLHFFDSSFFNKRDFMDYKKAPLNHLLEVRIWGFRGMESEIEFVRILLEFAVILKRMIITLSDEVFTNQDMKSDIKQKLVEFKITSPDGVMHFN